MKILGLIIMILGMLTLIFFGIMSIVEPENFKPLGYSFASRTNDYGAMALALVITFLGYIIFRSRKKRYDER